MIQNTILTVILLVIIGCGAQSNPDKDATTNTLDVVSSNPTTVPSTLPSEIPSSSIPTSMIPVETPLPTVTSTPLPTTVPAPSATPRIVPEVVLVPSIESSELPEDIGIRFPLVLNKASNLEFVQNFNEIEEMENMAFLNLSLVSQAMPKILNECAGSITCHFQAEEFLVEFNETNITLEKVEFNQYSKKEKYKYELTVSRPYKTNSVEDRNDTIRYKWTQSKKDIWTIYQNEENNISIRYFIDVDSNESMLVKNQKIDESVTFLVINKANYYHLSSNYIQKNNENFSTNIILEEDNLLIENQNIVQLNITNTNAKEGDYLLLPPQTNVENLNLKDILALTEGTFSFLNETFQGFLYTDKFLDNLDTLTIIELTKEDNGFKLLSEDSNDSTLSTH